ncbi:MAG: pantoate--beta-alanine ligase [Acidobacteriota bacterium]
MSVELLETIPSLRSRLKPVRVERRTIGLVPTMGALHAGHGSLIERARAECDWVVVTIFVNPLQFGPGEDFESYPRDRATDLEFCDRLGVDTVFAPSPEVMYPSRQRTCVEVDGIRQYLCGPHRPGHFRGVATVVLKLFNIVQPDRAYFGQKDAQQLKMIEWMTRDLNLPLTIVAVPTVRESDGLAVSSRNRYMTAEQRSAAPVLYRALVAARERVVAGEADPQRVRQAALDVLGTEPLAEVEYLEVVDPEVMQPVERIRGPVRVAAALRIGSTRLIDNMLCGG